MSKFMRRMTAVAWLATLLAGTAMPGTAPAATDGPYDLVVSNGRVVDPEQRTTEVLNVGIRGDRIITVSKARLTGRRTIDATGLVVAPGFIDLHAHGQSTKAQAIQALDGVTTAIDMEAGVLPVAAYYEQMSGRAVINFGAAVSQQCARQQALDRVPCPVRSPADGSFAPTIDIRRARGNFAVATPDEVAEQLRILRQGLDEGAPGIGVGIEYTPGASRAEILDLFRLAAERRAPIHLHVRRRTPDAAPGAGMAAAQEVIANAAVTGAPTHLVHVASTGQKDTAEIVRAINEARRRGIDVTTEAYPYTAGSTRIGSAVFDPGWQIRFGIDYGDLQWVSTGERLTEETFNRYREQTPSGSVILHMIAQSDVDAAVTDPDVMIASDGASWVTGGEHPRGAGTYARILGHYVRDAGSVSLVDAVRKMSYLPARRLAEYVPAMRRKGRLQAGADADLVVFDPATVTDRATYDKPTTPSVGMRYVIINGTPVVDDGVLVPNVFPGRGVRREPESPDTSAAAR